VLGHELGAAGLSLVISLPLGEFLFKSVDFVCVDG